MQRPGQRRPEQKTLSKLRQEKSQLERREVTTVLLVPKQMIGRKSQLSGSLEDIRRLKICRSSGKTSKTAAIALRKFLWNGGTTSFTTILIGTSWEKPTASGADSLPMWTNLIHC